MQRDRHTVLTISTASETSGNLFHTDRANYRKGSIAKLNYLNV